SRLQQFVNGKVKPKLTFRYEEHLYEGKTIGVIVIPKQKRPFFIANPYGKLKSNVAYVRRGSSTEEAEPTEVAAMALADSGRGQVLLDLSVLTPGNETVYIPSVTFDSALCFLAKKAVRQILWLSCLLDQENYCYAFVSWQASLPSLKNQSVCWK
uniref:Myosin motor domain-containing protein n=1 Tax=Steinernema glaseri TaxID=37863 RepID=A0A1I8AME0_9BILA